MRASNNVAAINYTINHFACGIFTVIVFLFGICSADADDSHEHVIVRTYSSELTYRCLVTVPTGYNDAPKQSWPMILFLHGGGTPKLQKLKQSVRSLIDLPAIVVIPLCPPSSDGPRYTNWNWKMLGEVVREMSSQYRVDPEMRSVIGFSMGGSGAWELPSFEPKLFSKSVVIAGVCHPWSLRQYPKIPVWSFVGTKDYMRKEQQETVTSARRFGVDIVETTWVGADHQGIFKNAMTRQPLLDWLVTDDDLRVAGDARNTK